jgi:uncharacterized membrane protein
MTRKRNTPEQKRQPPHQSPAKLPEDSTLSAEIIEAAIIDDPSILQRPQVRAVVMRAEFYQGPVPQGKQFAEYETAVPGSGMRLLDMSQKAMEAQIRLTENAQAKDFLEAGRGQWMAFGLALSTIVCATILGTLGGPWPGALFGTSGLGAIVYLFIQGKKRH